MIQIRSTGPYSGHIFDRDWDIMASTTKARKQEFESFEDSENMFSWMLTEMAQTRMIPTLSGSV